MHSPMLHRPSPTDQGSPTKNFGRSINGQNGASLSGDSSERGPDYGAPVGAFGKMQGPSDDDSEDDDAPGAHREDACVCACLYVFAHVHEKLG